MGGPRIPESRALFSNQPKKSKLMDRIKTLERISEIETEDLKFIRTAVIDELDKRAESEYDESEEEQVYAHSETHQNKLFLTDHELRHGDCFNGGIFHGF